MSDAQSCLWEEQLFETQLIIDGQAIAPGLSGHFERRDPQSDVVVTRAVACTVSQAVDAANAAARSFPSWSATLPAERAKVLSVAADLMTARADEVIPVASEEIGSSEAWTRFNIEVACSILRQASTLAEALRDEHDAEKGYILRRRPAGVVLGLAPWNAAITLATRAAAAPLACGNSVVLKGSEICPKTHEWVARVLNDAGLPGGVLNYITNAPDQAEDIVEALISHPAVRRINFTGSSRVGKGIALIAAQHMKRCLLELSGKGTLIVLADADLAEAAKAAAFGSFFNQGQICMSTERVIVEDAVADEFIALFAAEADRLRFEPGRPSPLGALISPTAAVRVRAMIEDALARGARLVCGGELAGGGLQPAILDEVTPGMRIFSEEAFGPIAAISRVSGPEEAESLANDTDFGLVASVFSKDVEKAKDMLARIEVGIGHVNGSTVYDDPSMPFGGVKASGYGRFGGLEAIHEFTECQWIAVHSEVASKGWQNNENENHKGGL